MKTLWQIANDLQTGQVTSRALTEQALDNIHNPEGQGSKAFVAVYEEESLKLADAMDGLIGTGYSPSPLAGIPISIKDLFDEAGKETLAGSVASKGEGVAIQDSVVVQKLRASGAIIMGRTNMTEYAYSGLGLNPHYGTPLNPYDRGTGRIPGGSSSGAAVSVTDGMANVALGSDTGGSVRIPSALCGLTGFKPTARRVSLRGVFPLSQSLDSIGPLGRSVDCCAMVDAVLTGAAPRRTRPLRVRQLRLAVLRKQLWQNVDDHVGDAIERTIAKLIDAGAMVEEIELEGLDRLPAVNEKGGFAAAEAYTHHRDLIARKGDMFDPRIVSRIKRGVEQSAADYLDLIAARQEIIGAVNRQTRSYDALLGPTVPIIAPSVDSLEKDESAYTRANMLMLRSCSIFNFLDRCAFSLPCHKPGEAPVGLMVVGETMGDYKLIDVASAIEGVIKQVQ